MISGQTIDSGDNSTNIQGKEVQVNNYGLSYSDVKDIAMSVFKSNFYDLGEKVESIIQDRAEKILDDYLEKLRAKNPKYIENTQNPDIRYVIYEAQKNYARRGDENVKKLLVETLIQRTIINNSSISELVLNEALEIIPKITSKQIDILSLIFINKYVSFSRNVPVEFYISIVKSVINNLDISEGDVFYQHLEYVSCLSVSIGSTSFNNIIKDKLNWNGNDDEISRKISTNPELVRLKNMWDNSRLCNCSLTSVGIAIAVNNINIKTGLNMDLNVWIRE